MIPLRIRTGVMRFDDGWNVIVRWNDDPPLVYDPTYATEAEAEAKAVEVARMIREKTATLPGVSL